MSSDTYDWVSYELPKLSEFLKTQQVNERAAIAEFKEATKGFTKLNNELEKNIKTSIKLPQVSAVASHALKLAQNSERIIGSLQPNQKSEKSEPPEISINKVPAPEELPFMEQDDTAGNLIDIEEKISKRSQIEERSIYLSRALTQLRRGELIAFGRRKFPLKFPRRIYADAWVDDLIVKYEGEEIIVRENTAKRDRVYDIRVIFKFVMDDYIDPKTGQFTRPLLSDVTEAKKADTLIDRLAEKHPDKFEEFYSRGISERDMASWAAPLPEVDYTENTLKTAFGKKRRAIWGRLKKTK